MQTSPVQNQSNVAPNQSSANKQQNASDVPFNQMLSQQISDRSNVNSTSNDNAKTANANQVNDSSKANEANQANNVDAAPKKPAQADGSDSKVAGNDKTKDGKEDASTDSTGATAVSAELMALVANHLNQANAKATDAAATAVSDDELSVKADARGSPGSHRTGVDEKDLLAKQADETTTVDKTQAKELSGKDGASKAASSFAATMSAIERSADSKKDLQAVTAKLQEALPAVPSGASQQLQQTALNLTQAASGQPTDKLTPQVGSPAWDQALGQKVVWMVAGSQQSASLTLNPPDLGPMQVVLHVSNGQADASFTAAQPEVRQALEAAMPKLREMMSDAGIQLGQATISAGMPNQQQNSGDQTGSGSRGFSRTNDSTESAPRIIGTTKITGGQGLVDTFA